VSAACCTHPSPPLQAARNLVAKAGAAKKVMHEVAGGYHELLMGPERDACIAHMVRACSACCPHVEGGGDVERCWHGCAVQCAHSAEWVVAPSTIMCHML
jgi:hypothetical protein